MDRKIDLKHLFAISALISIFLPSILVGAQTGLHASIDYLTDAQFPEVKAYVSVTDVQGMPVAGLEKSNFSVSEDGQPITGFDVSPVINTDQPLAIALVIDTSGSMAYGTPRPLDQAIQAAKTFVGSLAPADNLAVIQFSDTVKVVQDLTTDRSLANAALDSLKIEANTALYDSIVQAVSVLKNRGERRIIILITDGVDTGAGKFTFDMAVTEAQRWAIPVYPIGFGAVDKNALQRLATLTGGTAQIQPDSSSLGAAFSNILEILRKQYLIHFTSGLKADGAEHTLLIALDTQGWHEELTHTFLGRPGSVTVSLPEYQTGQVIGGKVRFAPTVLAPAPIAQFDVLVDDTNVSSITASPFEYVWDSTSLAPGEHTFTFMVIDTAGNTGETSIPLEVQIPISVTVSKPVDGETVSGSMTVSAEVPALHSVTEVQFFVDGNPIGEKLMTAPFEVTLDTKDLVAGPHILSVTAVDNQGYTAQTQTTINVGIKQQSGMWWLVLLAGLALAGVLIPLALRKRKSMKKTGSISPQSQQKPDEISPQSSKPGTSLRELEGQNPNQIWALGTGETHLGRKRDENDIPLKGINASRKHAVIRYDQGQYFIFGLNPDNPVIVNDLPLSQPRALQSGDVIRLGETILRFE